MKKISLILTLMVALAFLVGCDKSPTGPELPQPPLEDYLTFVGSRPSAGSVNLPSGTTVYFTIGYANSHDFAVDIMVFLRNEKTGAVGCIDGRGVGAVAREHTSGTVETSISCVCATGKTCEIDYIEVEMVKYEDVVLIKKARFKARFVFHG